MNIRLAGISEESFVDGPGIRFVVFGQGCPHRCPGCHNPQTHAFDAGYEQEITHLFEQMLKNPLQDGVTFSGGEPFAQPEAFSALAKLVKQKNMNLWAYTGYTFDQLMIMGEKRPVILELLGQLDVLVDGLFELENRTLEEPFRGSKNQRLIDVPKSLTQQKVILWEPPLW